MMFRAVGISANIIGQSTNTVDHRNHFYVNLSTLGTHYTMVQEEYPAVTRDIMLTPYGRDRNGLAIPGAIFYDKDFVQIENSIG